MAADALAARVGPNVNAMLDAIAIAAPGAAELAKRGKADNRFTVLRDKDRIIALPTLLEPFGPGGEGTRLRGVNGRRCRHDVVIDRRDLPEIVHFGWPYSHRARISWVQNYPTAMASISISTNQPGSMNRLT